MDILLTIHSLLRWLVLAVLLGGGTYALLAAPTEQPFRDRPFTLGAIVIDVQVAIGIALYLLTGAWDDDPFIAMIHPAAMLAVLGVLHGAIAGARRQPTSQRAYRRVAAAFLFGLLLTALAIPWEG